MRGFEIEKDLEHEAKVDAYIKYVSIKRRGNPDYKVNASDWAHAWEYAKEFYSKEFEESIKRLWEINESDLELLNKLNDSLSKIHG